jgi:mRNA guanylyltransferase
MNVEFCNGHAFKIDAHDLKEKIMLECDNIFGTKLRRNCFPGPQPVAIEIKDLDKLKNGYMVCEKSDGSRAILLLININNKPMCFIINRNNELYFLDLSFKKEVYEGSIFDAELIKNKKGEWNLLIHDCMAYNGISFLKSNHRLRYACVIDLIVKRYVNRSTDPLNIKTKLFYKFGSEIEKTWNHIQKTTENEIDGLIFTPIDGPIVFGRDFSLFKWKLPENNTVDFQIIFKNKKVYYYYSSKETLKIYKMYPSSSENYKNIINFIKVNKITDESPIIEFKIINDDYFIPYRYRSDKNVPNGEITVLNTFKNVKEAIQVKDLYSAPSSAADNATDGRPSTATDSTLAGLASASSNLAGLATTSSTLARLAAADGALTGLATMSSLASALP